MEQVTPILYHAAVLLLLFIKGRSLHFQDRSGAASFFLVLMFTYFWAAVLTLLS